MEGDAGASQLNPTDAEGSLDIGPDEADAAADEVDGQPDATDGSPEDSDELIEETPTAESGKPSRLGRNWLVSIGAALVLLSAGMAVGGYLALRSHHSSEAIARADTAAVQAAKDCVSATQAPDTATISASQQKIVECSTGDFGAQATIYSSMLVDAYKAANVSVQVSDMRAAVERHNDDGSMDVLVAVRVKVNNSQAADQEQGYRLRVQMAPVDGQYKIARLDQVST
ncbi:MAG: hypothetical protein JWR37_2514 [Mycobacterium sp.]|jgi:Mce-associated membrane protein|nr:hypothetical protein [Mycobacterium sp.]